MLHKKVLITTIIGQIYYKSLKTYVHLQHATFQLV